MKSHAAPHLRAGAHRPTLPRAARQGPGPRQAPALPPGPAAVGVASSRARCPVRSTRPPAQHGSNWTSKMHPPKPGATCTGGATFAVRISGGPAGRCQWQPCSTPTPRAYGEGGRLTWGAVGSAFLRGQHGRLRKLPVPMSVSACSRYHGYGSCGAPLFQHLAIHALPQVGGQPGGRPQSRPGPIGVPAAAGPSERREWGPLDVDRFVSATETPLSRFNSHFLDHRLEGRHAQPGPPACLPEPGLGRLFSAPHWRGCDRFGRPLTGFWT